MKIHVGLLIASFLLLTKTAYALSDQNRPEYKKEFDAYLSDLAIIAQTGKAPKNIILEEDLAKMSSNERIQLTVPKKKPLDDSMMFAQNQDAQIVNSVEIIRVPKEFQKEYADVYQEEKQTISAQSLIDTETLSQNQEDMLAIKIANHINPFRFLREVELTPLPSEVKTTATQSNDPMVNAYFNQLRRPYVSETASASTKDSSSSRPRSSGALNLRNSMFVD